MKFCFEIEKNNDEQIKIKKLVMSGDLEFLLASLLYLVTTITDSGVIEMEDVIGLLTGWEEEHNGKKCED